MLIRLYAMIARRPRSFAIGAGAVVVLLATVASGDGPLWPAAVALLAVTFVAAGALALPAVVAGRRPRFLVARGGAFLTPVDVPPILVVLSVMAALGGWAAVAFYHLDAEPATEPRRQIPLALAMLGLLGTGLGRPESRREGIAVHRDGVTVRRIDGSLTITWQAEPLVAPVDPPPTALERLFQPGDRVALLLRHGDLAQIDGRWPPDSIVPSTVDPAFLAWVVKEYADHPDRRAAIGTPEELRRLTQSGQQANVRRHLRA
ncbi:hypothetical protein ODJ79_28600 [Actinoplanes sp. KI2]|uniref:hypothetical protein n=1 Tax=Actinoplanes sp. KI2 TaxID=2983315 RepID=UPI0021D56C76|nr:hypothetical protein [Actinoplanes sp. KI2]MCU7727698.1 hypothetical protein [Actinoplanes sp. KI2]